MNEDKVQIISCLSAQSIQDALLFKQYMRRYITFNFKGKGNAQLHFFYPARKKQFKASILKVKLFC